MESINNFMNTIPAVIWSAIIASLLTIFGVWLTNRGNARRQSELLAHEEKKFKFEQNLALKKEVFLEVAASFSRALSVFPRLVDLTIPQKEMFSVMDEHGPTVAKSYLIAKEDTVSKLLAYSNEVTEAYFPLLKSRIILLDHNENITIYQDMISKAEKEQDRLIGIMKELNLQGNSDQHTWDYINKSIESQGKIIIEYNESIKEQQSILEPLHKEFAAECISAYARLGTSIAPVTIAVRKELDNDIDSKLFSETMNAAMARMEDKFAKEFLNE